MVRRALLATVLLVGGCDGGATDLASTSSDNDAGGCELPVLNRCETDNDCKGGEVCLGGSGFCVADSCVCLPDGGFMCGSACVPACTSASNAPRATAAGGHWNACYFPPDAGACAAIGAADFPMSALLLSPPCTTASELTDGPIVLFDGECCYHAGGC